MWCSFPTFEVPAPPSRHEWSRDIPMKRKLLVHFRPTFSTPPHREEALTTTTLLTPVARPVLHSFISLLIKSGVSGEVDISALPPLAYSYPLAPHCPTLRTRCPTNRLGAGGSAHATSLAAKWSEVSSRNSLAVRRQSGPLSRPEHPFTIKSCGLPPGPEHHSDLGAIGRHIPLVGCRGFGGGRPPLAPFSWPVGAVGRRRSRAPPHSAHRANWW